MQRVNPEEQRNDSGRIALHVLLVGFGLVIAMAGILRSARTSSDQVRRTVDREQAFYAAEAGIEAAITNLLAGGEGAMGGAERPVSFLRGSFWVRSQTLPSGEVKLISTSALGTLHRQVEAVVRIHRAPGIPALYLGSAGAERPLVLDGWGNGADRIIGGIYTAGDLRIEGDARCIGPVVAGGRVDGARGLGHRTLVDPEFIPLPQSNAIVVSLRDNGGSNSWAALSLRRNPSDRDDLCKLTSGDDFFLDGDHLPIPIPPSPKSGWVIRVPGNLWLANSETDKLVLRSQDGTPFRVTFVAEGSVFITGDIETPGDSLSALGIVALGDRDGDGNIVLFDPNSTGHAPRRVEAHLAARNRILGDASTPDSSLTIRGSVTALEGMDFGNGGAFTLRIQAPSGDSALPPSFPHGTLVSTYEILSWRETTPGVVP